MPEDRSYTHPDVFFKARGYTQPEGRYTQPEILSQPEDTQSQREDVQNQRFFHSQNIYTVQIYT